MENARDLKKFFQKNNSCLLLQFSMMATEGFEI